MQQKRRRRRNQDAGVHRENPKRQLNVSVFISDVVSVLLIAYKVYANEIKLLTQHLNLFFFKSKTVKKTKQKWWLHIFKHMHFSDFATWLWRQRPLQFSIRPFHSWADEPVWRLQVFTCIDSSTTVSTLGQSWACPQPGHNMPLDSDCKWNSSC